MKGTEKINNSDPGFGQSFLNEFYVTPNNNNNSTTTTLDHHRSSISEEEEEIIITKAAPLYITIGPPCAGKTQALRFQLERDGYDDDDDAIDHHDDVTLSSSQQQQRNERREISLHEQSDVYQRVPLAAFIFPTSRLESKLGSTVLRSGVTLQERLLDPSPPPLDKTDNELRNIILRVAGRMTPQEFADRTREQALEAGDTVRFFRNRRIEIAEDLIDAVEQVSVEAVGEVLFQMQLQQQEKQQQQQQLHDMQDENELPYHDDEEQGQQEQEESSTAAAEPKVDWTAINATSAHLLSARALIRTPFVELFVPAAIFRGGLDKAEEKLQLLLDNSPSNHPVSWANTNTRPVEYVAALKAAQRAGRPVHFLAWGHAIPRVSRRDLLRRTVSKFRRTGRYVPAGAVGAALGRVERLVKEAEKVAAKLSSANTAADNDTTCYSEEAIMAEASEQQEETGSLTDDDDDDDHDNDNNNNNTAHHLNTAFAALAGFSMDKDGYVTQIGVPKNFNQKPFRSRKNKGNHPRSSGRKQRSEALVDKGTVPT